MRGHARDHQVIAIGCRFCNLLRADHAARAAFVFNHEGLFQGFSQAHRNESAQRIRATASSVGHHDLHGALRPDRVLRKGHTVSERAQHCRHAQQAKARAPRTLEGGQDTLANDSTNQRKAFQVQILQAKPFGISFELSLKRLSLSSIENRRSP